MAGRWQRACSTKTTPWTSSTGTAQWMQHANQSLCLTVFFTNKKNNVHLLFVWGRRGRLRRDTKSSENSIIWVAFLIFLVDAARISTERSSLESLDLFEGSLEVKLPTIWTDEKQSREEAERRERLEERRVEEKESEERRCRCAKR